MWTRSLLLTRILRLEVSRTICLPHQMKFNFFHCFVTLITWFPGIGADRSVPVLYCNLTKLLDFILWWRQYQLSEQGQQKIASGSVSKANQVKTRCCSHKSNFRGKQLIKKITHRDKRCKTVWKHEAEDGVLERHDSLSLRRSPVFTWLRWNPSPPCHRLHILFRERPAALYSSSVCQWVHRSVYKNVPTLQQPQFLAYRRLKFGVEVNRVDAFTHGAFTSNPKWTWCDNIEANSNTQIDVNLCLI